MNRLLLDTTERVIGTYAVAFLGLLLADGFDLTSLSSLKAAVGTLIGDKTTVGWIAKNTPH